jgi:hypothetical protein
VRKPVFLITRYSVVGKAQHTWNLAREASSHSEYKAQLLDPGRLRSRLSVFRAVTIPSVWAQLPAAVELHWIVLIAADLPAKELSELKAALRPVQERGVRVNLVKVADSDEAADVSNRVYPGMGMAARLAITDALNGEAAIFASVRLDDDDALAASYLQALAGYLKPDHVGSHISFPLGIQAVFTGSDRPLTDARAIDKPLIALGLAFINSFDGAIFAAEEVHVLNFGNHSDVIARTAVVNDRTLRAYLRVLTSTSDLGDSQQLSHPPATKKEISSLELPLVVRPAKKKLADRFARP